MDPRHDEVPMNPRSYNYDGFKTDGQAVAVPQTVISIAPSVLPIRDHVLWSIFTFIYMNFCCLGFLALVFSVKSRDRKVVGDAAGAQHYASAAKVLNIIATTLTLLIIAIIIILLVVGVFQIASFHQQYQSYNYGK
uniref:Interferon induced transmembrane protein n=1 Tax=Callorhinchus milii TaxID=7868 RepID=K4GHR5_CALMI|nr:interferon induced transmembrane protein [Callorhinchus milii]